MLPNLGEGQDTGTDPPQLLQKDQGTFSQNLSFTFAPKRNLQPLHNMADQREWSFFIPPNSFFRDFPCRLFSLRYPAGLLAQAGRPAGKG